MECLKTNEFQRRRRLRMQQVREQSKELAREVRERAGVERSRQLSGVEETRRLDYVERQERVVQRLERIHEGALRTVGSAHSQAGKINENEKNIIRSKDQSKQRAKVAVEELNRNKQQELDKKKQQLERKLIARKLANARSRSKLNKTPLQEEGGSGDAATKNISNPDLNLKIDANGSEVVKKSTALSVENQNVDNKDSEMTSEFATKKKDMETQWSLNGLREWTPSNVLSSEGLQDNNSQVNNIPSAKDCEKSTGKRANLFAVSAEMPEDLLGDINKKAPAVDLENKPSVTIVSDFLRARDHRLQKPTPGFHKVSGHELQGLRETFANLRTARKDFTLRGTEDICQVVDDDAIPTPCWEPVADCGFCKVDYLPSRESKMNRNLSHVNRVRTRSRSAVSLRPCDHSPSEGTVPAPLPLHPVSGATVYSHESHRQEDKSPSRLSKLSASGQSQPVRKNRSVMHYDHATKAIRDLPVGKDNVVEKISVKDLDAYSLAVKESEQTVAAASSRPELEVGGRRSRIAVSRQRVAQEYKDTMEFLQSVSRINDKSKPIESAYMDDYQQHQKNIGLQRKLQQEFEKVQAVSKPKARPISVSEVIPKADKPLMHKSKELPKSTTNSHHREEETTITAKTSLNDAEALLHQIRTSTTVREDSSAKLSRNKDEIQKSSKAGNTVTFDITPSTYTYTSRVKHTPPTRDKPSTEDQQTKDYINIDNTESGNIDIEVIEPDHTCDDSLVSDCSSDYDLIIQRHNKAKSRESSDTKTDVRKFIVYKIKDQSDDDAINKIKKKYKTKDESAENKNDVIPAFKSSSSSENPKAAPITSENLEKSREHPGVDPEKDGQKLLENKTNSDLNCWCNKKKGANDKEGLQTKLLKSSHKSKKPLQWDIGADSPESQESCKCRRSKVSEADKQHAASAATSAATFQTATSEKSSSEQSVGMVPQPGAGGYVKVLDEVGAEAGKFYIGASNLSRDDPYEVIIQLKRKNGHSDKGTANSQPIRTSKPMLYREAAEKTLQKQIICKCSTLKTPVPDAQFSSCSSTVYMSPPDLILPKVLKVDNPLASGGVFQMNLQNVEQEESISLSHYSRRNRPTPRKESEVEINDTREPKVRSTQKRKQHTKSTSKSGSSTSSVTAAPSGDYKRMYRNSNSSCNGCPCNIYRTLRKRKTCKGSTAKLEKSKRSEKHKQHQLEKKILEHYQNYLQNIVKNVKNPTTVPSSTKSQSNLSPSIKKYINELLEIHKDEPKSAKMSALHCSTVSTPGSSVVNVPSNVDLKCSEWEQDPIQAKLNEIITKNLMKKPQTSQHKCSRTLFRQNLNNFQKTEAASSSTSSDLQSIERGVGDIPRLHLHRLRNKPKSVHRNKVKSLNISKNIINYLQTGDSKRHQSSIYLTKSTSKLNSSDAGQRSSDVTKRFKPIRTPKGKSDSRSSQTANIVHKSSNTNVEKEKALNIKNHKNILPIKRVSSAPSKHIAINVDERNKRQITSKTKPMVVDAKIKEAVIYPEMLLNESPSDKEEYSKRNDAVIPQNINAPSVEANHPSNSDNMLIAEQKLQNMEKIADLTEKCTKRLSNLAKVLDEVRKNKSTIYNQMSSTDTSLSDKSSGKRENSFASKCEGDMFIEKPTDAEKFTTCNKSSLIPSEITSHKITDNNPKGLDKDKHDDFKMKEQQIQFVPILGDIPKPDQSLLIDTKYGKMTQSDTVNIPKSQINPMNASTQNEETVKIRAKPPPALYRVNLKNEETLVPHELSTVLEVDSPISTRNASSRVRTNDKSPININVVSSGSEVKPTRTNASSNLALFSAITPTTPAAPPVSPSSPDHKIGHTVHLVNKGNNTPFSTPRINTADEFKSSVPSTVQHKNFENSKLQMIDLNKFNEIMMQPFISIEEYARQYDAVLLEEASNFEDTALNKNTPNRDEEISSDSTLPDIISELLKRNIISEPFNFDGISNVDYNALSSESNLSLALSKIKRNTKKVTINANNQDNGDTSDTLSFSSKVDLEKAFEELGIGWASSTLKKTKEALALSSSTSTVSSVDHTNYRKFKKFDTNKQLFQAAQSLIISDKTKTDIATMEPVQAVSGIPPDSENKENLCEAPKQFSKHSVQLQTSLSFQPPVSVKEFLTSSLADKITFASKSPRPKVEEHYSSLYSTKLSTDNLFGNSAEKAPATDTSSHHDATKQTRQRTSTPVQLFKALTFNSSTSSYNNSNGLFSNVDDLSSVKGTSVSLRNSSSTDRDELTVPNCSLKVKKLD